MDIDRDQFRRPNGVWLEADAEGLITIYLRENVVGQLCFMDDDSTPLTSLSFELEVDQDVRHILIVRYDNLTDTNMMAVDYGEMSDATHGKNLRLDCED